MNEYSITVLLDKIAQGEKHLLNNVYTRLYQEIKITALKQINNLNTGQTITPTVLAHECYLKMIKLNSINMHNKRHFLSCLAKSMRQVLIDVLRSKSSIKRQHMVADGDFTTVIGEQDIDLKYFDIERSLVKIEKINPLFCEVLEQKLMFNLTFKEIAETIDKSERQVNRIWKQAKVLLIALTQNTLS